MKRVLVAYAVTALAPLSACNRPADAASAAPQIELPTIAAGKWQETHALDGGKGGFPGARCHKERTLWEVMDVGVAGLKNCQRSIEKTGNGFLALYRCSSGGSAITIRTTVSGDFTNGYSLESIQTFEPALNGTTSQRIAIEARRHQPC